MQKNWNSQDYFLHTQYAISLYQFTALDFNSPQISKLINHVQSKQFRVCPSQHINNNNNNNNLK
jgi:hypothetical protein